MVKTLFKSRIFILIFFLTPIGVFAADSVMVLKQKSIEKQYRALRSKSDWISIDTLSLGGPVKPGYAIYSSSSNGIEKIIAQKYGKSSQVKSEYYLENGKPFFVYSFRYVYNRAIDYDSTAMKKNNDTEVFDFKKSRIVEVRDYFENGRLINQITNFAQSGSTSEEFLSKETYTVTKELEMLKEFYKSHWKVKSVEKSK